MSEPVDGDLLRLLEALLFASAEPMSERMLAARLPEDTDVQALLTALKADYAERGVNVMQAGNTWAFRTAPDLASRLTKEVAVTRKPSRAAVETLAIIAYHQPVTRAEIEEIRGVGLNRGTLDVLLEAGWIRPRGRRRTPGRPVTWGTSEAFLDHFGLEGTDDLPGVDDLKAAGLLDARPAIDAARKHAIPVASAADGEASNDDADDDEFDDDEDGGGKGRANDRLRVITEYGVEDNDGGDRDDELAGDEGAPSEPLDPDAVA